MIDYGAPRARVVFVNRYYAPDHSATSLMLSGVARALAAAGLAVTVVTSRQLYEDAGAQLPPREFRDGVRVIRVPGTCFGRRRLVGRALDYLSFYAGTFVVLASILRRGVVVVAKTDPPLVALVCAPAAWLRRAQLVNWLQDVFPEVASELGMAFLPQSVVRLIAGLRDAVCRRAMANVVLGERMREYFLGRGVAAERLVVIPNWADGELIAPLSTESSRLRAELGLGGRFVLAYCGNLGRAHDYATLLAAAERLQGQDDIRFAMVGGGAGLEAVRREVAQRGLGNFVFAPYQPEARLGDTLAAGDVHLVCLRPQLEGLIVPSKLYGVLAAGRPAIFWGDPDGEIARELRRTGAGLSVITGDADGLAAAIVRLRDDPSARAAMSRSARAAYLESYSRELAASRWQLLLDAGPAVSSIRHGPCGRLDGP